MCLNSKKKKKKKIEIILKNFQEIKITLIKKRFLGKATSHNDHYMVNTGSQRSRFDCN